MPSRRKLDRSGQIRSLATTASATLARRRVFGSPAVFTSFQLLVLEVPTSLLDISIVSMKICGTSPERIGAGLSRLISARELGPGSEVLLKVSPNTPAEDGLPTLGSIASPQGGRRVAISPTFIASADARRPQCDGARGARSDALPRQAEE